MFAKILHLVLGFYQKAPYNTSCGVLHQSHSYMLSGLKSIIALNARFGSKILNIPESPHEFELATVKPFEGL